MKKKVVIGVFSALILITIVAILAVLISACNLDYEADPNAKYAALGAYMFMCLGGCVVFYECDLFYTVYYFFVKPKTVLRSILHILSHLSLVLLGVSLELPSIMLYLPNSVKINSELVFAVLFLLYTILRSASILVSVEESVHTPE